MFPPVLFTPSRCHGTVRRFDHYRHALGVQHLPSFWRLAFSFSFTCQSTGIGFHHPRHLEMPTTRLWSGNRHGRGR